MVFVDVVLIVMDCVAMIIAGVCLAAVMEIIVDGRG
jgi:hypothetical protein